MQTVSLKRIMSSIIRAVGSGANQYLSDMPEWIWDGMEQLQTQMTLKQTATCLNVCFHAADLPCGLSYVDAVIYQGVRLQEKQTSLIPSLYSCAGRADNIAAFTSIPVLIPVEFAGEVVPDVDGNINHFNWTLPLSDVPESQSAWFQLEPGVLKTNVPDGKMIIVYRTMPVDTDGYPLVPDIGPYKEALIWWTRARMIGAGYNDPKFSFNDCMHWFENVYAPRAIAEVNYPSPSRMETIVDSSTRLLPQGDYFQSFYNVDKEGVYRIPHY
jgi:hypothetical protein